MHKIIRQRSIEQERSPSLQIKSWQVMFTHHPKAVSRKGKGPDPSRIPFVYPISLGLLASPGAARARGGSRHHSVAARWAHLGKVSKYSCCCFFSQPCLIIKGYCTVYTQYICVYIYSIIYYTLYVLCSELLY